METENTPHIWKVYAKAVDGKGNTLAYQEMSLHASEEGAALEVEKQKAENKEVLRDPRFTVGYRKVFLKP